MECCIVRLTSGRALDHSLLYRGLSLSVCACGITVVQGYDDRRGVTGNHGRKPQSMCPWWWPQPVRLLGQRELQFLYSARKVKKPLRSPIVSFPTIQVKYAVLLLSQQLFDSFYVCWQREKTHCRLVVIAPPSLLGNQIQLHEFNQEKTS